jgi:hypothetical protein
MGLEVLIRMLVSVIGGYLFKPEGAAKYAKWFIIIRNYLLILFPLDQYPEGDILGNSAMKGVDPKTLAVPVEAVKQESKDRGFNIPFIKGM